MAKKKKMKDIPVVMHQHNDEAGRIFGAKHPLHLEHNNERTQIYHDFTVGKIDRIKIKRY